MSNTSDLPALSAQGSRDLDQIAIETLGFPPHSLMENAGHSLAAHCLQSLAELAAKRVVILCGTGNNGGDGLVCARHLADRVDSLRVCLLGSSDRIGSPEARLNHRLLADCTGPPLEIGSRDEFARQLPPAPWLGIDALFGTGLARPIEGFRADCLALFDEHALFKLAADIPSGLSADTGEILGLAPHCDLTVTFMTPNHGHLAAAARPHVGRLVVEPIGLPPSWIRSQV